MYAWQEPLPIGYRAGCNPLQVMGDLLPQISWQDMNPILTLPPGWVYTLPCWLDPELELIIETTFLQIAFCSCGLAAYATQYLVILHNKYILIPLDLWSGLCVYFYDSENGFRASVPCDSGEDM